MARAQIVLLHDINICVRAGIVFIQDAVVRVCASITHALRDAIAPKLFDLLRGRTYISVSFRSSVTLAQSLSPCSTFLAALMTLSAVSTPPMISAIVLRGEENVALTQGSSSAISQRQ